MSGPHIELTSEQQDLVSRLCEWYRNSDQQTFSYTGAAGTGKTTVIRAFIEELHIKKYVACAFVGKAVTVLSRQGLPASTIHSLIYNVGWIPVKDDDGNPVLKEDGTPKMKVEFALKSHINGHPQLIIVDEATMVNDDLAEDILSFGIKTVFIGDCNQLHPVFGISSVMLYPNFRLTKIMRQAEGNPIVYLSQRVLKRQPLIPGNYGQSRVLQSLQLHDNFREYDTIIAARNSERDRINNHIRHNVLKIRSPYPVMGDRLICRQNDWSRSLEGDLYLTTGMTGTVLSVDRSLGGSRFMSIDFKPDISRDEFYNLPLDMNYIKLDYEDRKLYGFSHYEKFEYGYAVTCHACQGSQYDRVLYLCQWFHDADLTTKVNYTAITRAVECIDITYNLIYV